MSDLSKISFGGTEYNVKDTTARAESEKKVTAAGGDISNTKIATADSITTAYPIPDAGDTAKGFLGKMKKFCEDIRNTTTGACFIGQIVNNCVTNNAKLPLSAAQGKVLMDLVTQLNADLGKCFGPGMAIPTGGNLDDYTTPGSYYSIDTNTTATLKNVPSWVTTGFRMEVINTTITGWFIQKIYSNHTIQNTTIRLHAGIRYLDWCRSITNKDFFLANKATKFAAGHNSEINRSYLQIYVADNKYYQLTIGTDILKYELCENGKWTAIWEK